MELQKRESGLSVFPVPPEPVSSRKMSNEYRFQEPVQSTWHEQPSGSHQIVLPTKVSYLYSSVRNNESNHEAHDSAFPGRNSCWNYRPLRCGIRCVKERTCELHSDTSSNTPTLLQRLLAIN